MLVVVLRWLWLLREWRVEVLEDFSVDDIERHGEPRGLVGQDVYIILHAILVSQYSFVGVVSCTNCMFWQERTNYNDVTKTKRQQT